MGFIFIIIAVLGTFTAFMLWRRKLLKSIKQEMDWMTEYGVIYRQKLLDDGALEVYNSKSGEELQSELCNLEYQIHNLRYPEDKEAMLEAAQRRSLIEEVLVTRGEK